MRTLRIHRKKKFAGALIPYWVITKISKTQFIEMLQSVDEETDNDEAGCVYIDLIEDKFGERIKNGEAKVIEIADDVNSFFVANGVGGISDEVFFETGLDIFRYEIDTKGGFKVPSYPCVNKVEK